MKPSGGTATGDALATSLADGHARRGKKAPGAIVLLSDGKATHGRDPLPVADEAKRLGIPIYTVALGTAAGTLPNGDAVPPDTATLRADRRALRRPGVHGRRGRRAERGLRAARLRGRDGAGAARGHRRCSPAARRSCCCSAAAFPFGGSGGCFEKAFRSSNASLTAMLRLRRYGFLATIAIGMAAPRSVLSRHDRPSTSDAQDRGRHAGAGSASAPELVRDEATRARLRQAAARAPSPRGRSRRRRACVAFTTVAIT